MRTSNIIQSNEFNGETLLPTTHHKFQNGFHGEILQRLSEIMDLSVSQSSQVFVVRLDYRFPVGAQNTDDNKAFTQHLAYQKQILQSNYGFCYYLWRREATDNSSSHYHIVLFLDGNRIQNGWTVMKLADRLWAQKLNTNQDGLVHLCQPNSPLSYGCGFKLRRNHEDYETIRQDVFCWLSYLAKVSPDGSNFLKGRNWNSSER